MWFQNQWQCSYSPVTLPLTFWGVSCTQLNNNLLPCNIAQSTIQTNKRPAELRTASWFLQSRFFFLLTMVSNKTTHILVLYIYNNLHKGSLPTSFAGCSCEQNMNITKKKQSSRQAFILCCLALLGRIHWLNGTPEKLIIILPQPFTEVDPLLMCVYINSIVASVGQGDWQPCLQAWLRR